MASLLDVGVAMTGTYPDMTFPRGQAGIVPFLSVKCVVKLSLSCRVLYGMLKDVPMRRLKNKWEMKKFYFTQRRELHRKTRERLPPTTAKELDEKLYDLFKEVTKSLVFNEEKWEEMDKLFRMGATPAVFPHYFQYHSLTICEFIVKLLEKVPEATCLQRSFQFLSNAIASSSEQILTSIYSGYPYWGYTIEIHMMNFWGCFSPWATRITDKNVQNDNFGVLLKNSLTLFMEMVFTGVPFIHPLEILQFVEEAKKEDYKRMKIQREMLEFILQDGTYNQELLNVPNLFNAISKQTKRMDLIRILFKYIPPMAIHPGDLKHFSLKDHKVFSGLMQQVPKFTLLVEPILPAFFFYFLARKASRPIDYLLSRHPRKVVYSRNEDGDTPLLFVCGLQGNNLKIVKKLIQAGSDIAARNNNNQGLLEKASLSHNTKLLLFLQTFQNKYTNSNQ